MNRMKNYGIPLIASILLLLSFTSQNIVAQNNCPKWGQDSIKATQEISLYREFFKQNNYKDAIKHWRYVFTNAPGARQTTHIDGVKMYKNFIDNEKNPTKKQAYIDTLLMIFDQRLACFGKDGDVLGRKGVEMVIYKQDDQKTFETMKESFEIQKNETSAFQLYYYILSSILNHKKNNLTDEQLMDIYNKVNDVIEKNISDNKKEADKYSETRDRIDELISSTGILNCENLKALYKSQYEKNPNDKELWKKIYGQMRIAKCADDDLFLEVSEKLYQAEPDESKARILAFGYIGKKNLTKAAKYFREAANLTNENEKKADYYLRIAEIEQNLGDYESSRSSALKAASFRSNWGEPYLHIGDLYASSGSKCGSGTGFESQVVVWSAIDMYEKAKAVDGSLAGKANNKIANYSKYMPSKEECFFRGLKEGDSFKVSCWINESTKVRYGTAQ